MYILDTFLLPRSRTPENDANETAIIPTLLSAQNPIKRRRHQIQYNTNTNSNADVTPNKLRHMNLTSSYDSGSAVHQKCAVKMAESETVSAFWIFFAKTYHLIVVTHFGVKNPRHRDNLLLSDGLLIRLEPTSRFPGPIGLKTTQTLHLLSPIGNRATRCHDIDTGFCSRCIKSTSDTQYLRCTSEIYTSKMQFSAKLWSKLQCLRVINSFVFFFCKNM